MYNRTRKDIYIYIKYSPIKGSIHMSRPSYRSVTDFWSPIQEG